MNSLPPTDWNVCHTKYISSLIRREKLFHAKTAKIIAKHAKKIFLKMKVIDVL